MAGYKSPTEPGIICGRAEEREYLERVLKSDEAEFVAVYGRRRVGKTYLVREFFRRQMWFEMTGVWDATSDEQLDRFNRAFDRAEASRSKRPRAFDPARDWNAAFDLLVESVERSRSRAKKVIFLDEVPWLASRRSRFLPALDHFWNSWASQRRDVILIVCGSAASWMISKIIRGRGGLHNRITRRIRLQPFTLGETEDFLRRRGVRLRRDGILELYMATGGVPHYLKEAEPGLSAGQIIDRLCFRKTGLLRGEFDEVYRSLFDDAGRHVGVVKALAAKRNGLTRGEIAKAAKIPSGGTLTATLDELEECGFIMRSVPFGRLRKDAVYRLADEHSLFHLKWIVKHRSGARDSWAKKRKTPSWRAWSGYAFEGICMKHEAQIKEALKIGGVDTESSSWSHRPTSKSDKGAQIDLVIDRDDRCINLCEMKFYEGEFGIDKRYAAELLNKRDTFLRTTRTKKTPFLTMVTVAGVRDGRYLDELIDQSIDVNALFL